MQSEPVGMTAGRRGRRVILATWCVLGLLATTAGTAAAATTSISGRITLPGGEAAVGFLVSYVGVTATEELVFGETLTNADGTYVLAVDHTDLALVWAAPFDTRSDWADTFYGGGTAPEDALPLDGRTAHTGIDIEMVLGGTVRGEVTRAGGDPIQDGWVDVEGRGAPISSGNYGVRGAPSGIRLVEFSRAVTNSPFRATDLDLVEVRAGEQAVLDHEFPQHLSPVQPAPIRRLADTRVGRPHGAVPVPKLKVGGNRLLRVDLRRAVDAGVLPPDIEGGLAAVSLNVTATGSTAGGHLTAFPCGDVPNSSNINFAAGQTIANAAVVNMRSDFAVTGGHDVCVLASVPVDVIIDVNGWLPLGGGAVSPGRPYRLVDTRAGRPQGAYGVQKRKIGPPYATWVPGYPANSLNITVTGAAGPGYLTAYPCDSNLTPPPPSSTLNFARGGVASTAAIVPGREGGFCVYASSPVDVIIDVNTFFLAPSGFTPVAGVRLADTRPGRAPLATAKAKVRPGAVLAVDTGTRAWAANLNIAVTNPDREGYLTVYPCGTARPTASNINFVKGQTIANLVLSPLSFQGEVCIASSVPTDVVVDLNGTFDGSMAAYWPS